MNLSKGISAISTNARVLVWPFILLAILLFLFIFVLKIGIGQIISLREELVTSKAEEVILSQKLNVLNTSQESALPLADLSLIALPSENPALTIISQLKTLSAERGITISNIEASGGAQQETTIINTIEVNLTLNGEIAPTLDFLKTLKTTSPLVTLDEVKVNSEVGLARVEVKIFGQFAPLPTTLPAIASPLNELSAEDKDILAKISTYNLPVFTEVPPSGPYERPDLFNF